MNAELQNFFGTWKENKEYFDALTCLASLSKLFSDSKTPYLDYRLAENIFCKYFSAINDARSCTAYDARIGLLGVGIKTFILKGSLSSVEKIAEFNHSKPELDPLKGEDLAVKLAELRNTRIEKADALYGTNDRIYHIVGRTQDQLHIFNTKYEEIPLDQITIDKEDNTSLWFHDKSNQYCFNRSKSVLMKRFYEDARDSKVIPIEFVSNPLELLQGLLHNFLSNSDKTWSLIKGKDYIVLPLYGIKNKQRVVFPKSGLNQWNAEGRKRNDDEVYIPIPRQLHNLYPTFFPKNAKGDFTKFYLKIPNMSLPEDEQYLLSKVCQQGGKALMSDPNSALGHWILRTVMGKKEGELITIEDLNRFGIDSVLIVKHHNETRNELPVYSITFVNGQYETWEQFISSED
jgi:hypothetical protein